MAHGTPERLEDLGDFYTEIRRGRPPSSEQLEDLRRRYDAIGGLSPLNAVTERQAQGIAAALDERRPGAFVVRAGTRFAAPRIEHAVAELSDAGCHRLVAVALAPHSSRLSTAEYERRARQAAEAAGTARRRPLEVVMVGHWWDAEGFDTLVARRVRDAMAGLERPVVVFTAHSLPVAAAAGDSYAEQVRHSAGLVAAAAGLERFTVAWQSAGRTEDEWLGPDVRDVVAELAAEGAHAVVVCPFGFVADHLEVLYDVDIEVRAVAERVGVAFARSESFNDAPDFCALVAGVVTSAADAAAA